MPMNSRTYKNIIFDLGGVILNIDYALLIRSFSKIGLPGFEEHFSQKNQKELFDQYEKGEISSADFCKNLKTYCKEGVTDQMIKDAWNAMLLDLPKERLDLLYKMKRIYRTFLLSNTNEIHIQSINEYLKKEYSMEDLSSCFEKMYLSFEINKRKPDAEIFELVLKENKLVAGETLFIDDSVQHIESAQKLGLQTYFLDVRKESILNIFA